VIVLVGGQARKVGKSSVVAGLIAALPECAWTAIKVTHHKHGQWGMTEEHSPTSTDTGRFLAAGARRSFWIRARQDQMARVVDQVRRLADESAHIVIESNALAEFIQADLTLMVLDGGNAEYKPGARRLIERADALIVAGALPAGFHGLRYFPVEPPQYVTEAIAAFVRGRLSGS
jgi:hypothetical protein